MTVAEASEQQRAWLLPLAKERFPFEELIHPLIVDGHCRVKVKANWYSAPASPGMRVGAVVGPSWIEIKHDNRCLAQHERCYGRGHQILNLEHYLPRLAAGLTKYRRDRHDGEKQPEPRTGLTWCPMETWSRLFWTPRTETESMWTQRVQACFFFNGISTTLTSDRSPLSRLPTSPRGGIGLSSGSIRAS
ncbi:MAG TPA: hypothetical protein VKE70_22075 [Candidatus Solibacter sp.]|nr:hypothetical protein [Candidatus Solibacter sp.]